MRVPRLAPAGTTVATRHGMQVGCRAKPSLVATLLMVTTACAQLGPPEDPSTGYVPASHEAELQRVLLPFEGERAQPGARACQSQCRAEHHLLERYAECLESCPGAQVTLGKHCPTRLRATRGACVERMVSMGTATPEEQDDGANDVLITAGAVVGVLVVIVAVGYLCEAHSSDPDCSL